TRLALALEDVDEQRGDARGGERDQHDGAEQQFLHLSLPSPVIAPWPTDRWQCTQRTSWSPDARASCSCIRAPWQLTQASCRIRLFLSVIMMGSWKFCSVNAAEWRKPFSPLARYLRIKPCGRWQSTQVATPWWLAFCQPSYCGCMMWQLTHTFGSSLMYERPSAYRKVKPPMPARRPTSTARTIAERRMHSPRVILPAERAVPQ